MLSLREVGVADWLLCQPVRVYNISAEWLPTVFLIGFGQNCCAKQQHFYELTIQCVLWFELLRHVFSLVSDMLCFSSATEA